MYSNRGTPAEPPVPADYSLQLVLVTNRFCQADAAAQYRIHNAMIAPPVYSCFDASHLIVCLQRLMGCYLLACASLWCLHAYFLASNVGLLQAKSNLLTHFLVAALWLMRFRHHLQVRLLTLP